MWVLLGPPRFGGANYASNHDNWSRHRQIGISGPWRRRGRQGDRPPAVEASLRSGVLPEAAAVPDRYRSLRLIASLVARTPGTWPHRAANAAGLRQTLRQTAEERCDRRRGDL